jgi:hypothetical protein
MRETVDRAGVSRRTPCRLPQPRSIVTGEIRIDEDELGAERLHVQAAPNGVRMPQNFEVSQFSPVERLIWCIAAASPHSCCNTVIGKEGKEMNVCDRRGRGQRGSSAVRRTRTPPAPTQDLAARRRRKRAASAGNTAIPAISSRTRRR